MKLVIDMNLAPAWRGLLVSAGFDAVHWSEAGNAGAADEELMAWARTNGAIVLTHDLDFGAILAATRAVSPSVVVLRAQDPTPGAIGSVVVSCLRQFADQLAAGAIVAVDHVGGRVRVLPLSRT